MKNLWILALPFLLAGFENAHAETRLIISGRSGTGDGFTLTGPDARQQLLLTVETPDAHPRDVTGEVTFRAEPAGIVEFLDKGFLKPLADGKAVITAELNGAAPSSIEVTVERSGTPLPICRIIGFVGPEAARSRSRKWPTSSSASARPPSGGSTDAA